ncbi:MAG: RpoL/Rpb11 RNA polymerase subunit family protein [archaeon]
MELKIITNEKNKLEIEMDNLTMAELLRNELWNDKATELAAWRRDHPSKDPILVLQTKGKSPQKVLSDTIDRIQKLNKDIISSFKKVFK